MKEKIKGAGIGRALSKKLTPEEQEVAEEASGGKDSAGESESQFVCKVSGADRAAALSEAFQKAKQEATELARAAGTELGALRHLSRDFTSPSAADDSEQAFKTMMLQQMSAVLPLSPKENPGDEASAPAATAVELDVTVAASFAVK